MIDPPRKEAIESIAICKKAGIRVIMITGDNPIDRCGDCEKIGDFFRRSHHGTGDSNL